MWNTNTIGEFTSGRTTVQFGILLSFDALTTSLVDAYKIMKVLKSYLNTNV